MITALFLAFVAFSALVALTDWRRGWMLALVVGLLQDPARKLTPGTPVAMTFSVMIVYAAIIVASHREIHAALRDFANRYGRVAQAAIVAVLFIFLAALTGIMTFGVDKWKVPVLSLLIYITPVPAILFGYIYLRREEMLYRFLSVYAALTSLWMIGSLLEHNRIAMPGLGLIAWSGDYIRFMPGVHIRMVSGFYRAPDIMGWHAAMLCSISIAMAVRAGMTARAWPWLAATAWGFFNCLISGRRKAVYFVLVFIAVFVWRYLRRLQQSQLWAMAGAGIVLLFVIQNLSSDEQTRAYTRGSVTSRIEVQQRLEGGLRETVRQVGIMGAGLGSATQGVRHLLGTSYDVGWQEGGLGKLAVEIGVPGLVAVAFLGWSLLQLFLTLTRIGDVPGTSQIARVTLFALLCANGANFMASAQAYTDPMLALLTAFLVGCLFATGTLDERLPDEERARLAPLATAPATA